MKKYAVVSPLKLDGQDIEIGSTIELSAEQAKPLLETKPPVIELDTSAAAITAPEIPEERIAAIRVAIAGLDKDNKALFLSDGATPDVKALTTILGWNVSAADRNLAMQAE